MFAEAIQAALHDNPGPNAADALAAEEHAADTQFYRQVLHDFITIGTDLARLLHQRAIAQAMQQATATYPAPADAPDPTVAFDRIARAVRRCIALARRLADPVPPASPAQTRTLRVAGNVAQPTAQDGGGGKAPGDGEAADAEPLHAGLLDRPDAPDLDDDPRTRPVADIIADICRDLGLAAPPGAHPWTGRTPEDIGRLCARAASRASPPGPGQAAGCAAAQPAPASSAPTGHSAASAVQPDPAGLARTRPGPAHPGSAPPDNATAPIPRQPAHTRGHWRPPPGT